MGIIGAILLGFIAAAIIYWFDLKENVWHEKKEKDNKDSNYKWWKDRGYIAIIIWILLIILAIVGKHYGL